MSAGRGTTRPPDAAKVITCAASLRLTSTGWRRRGTRRLGTENGSMVLARGEHKRVPKAWNDKLWSDNFNS